MSPWHNLKSINEGWYNKQNQSICQKGHTQTCSQTHWCKHKATQGNRIQPRPHSSPSHEVRHLNLSHRNNDAFYCVRLKPLATWASWVFSHALLLWLIITNRQHCVWNFRWCFGGPVFIQECVLHSCPSDAHLPRGLDLIIIFTCPTEEVAVIFIWVFCRWGFIDIAFIAPSVAGCRRPSGIKPHR